MENIDAWLNAGNHLVYDPKYRHCAYWPTKGYQEGLRLLSIGMSSYEAAVLAYTNPTAQIIAIDNKQENIDANAILKNKYQLDNLQLNAVENYDEPLDGIFDFINVTSHLFVHESPFAYLQELSKLLSPDGIITGMLPGKYGQLGIDLLHQVFIDLSLNESAEDKALALDYIKKLNIRHPLKKYLANKPENFVEDNFSTLFKESQVMRRYNVAELFEQFNAHNLIFHSWLFNGMYNLQSYLGKDAKIAERIASLSASKQASSLELISGQIAYHYFNLCNNMLKTKQDSIRVNTVDVMSCVPVSRINHIRRIESASVDQVVVCEKPQPEVMLDTKQIKLFEQFDGHKTVRQCCLDANVQGDEHDVKRYLETFMQSLLDAGAVYLRYPNTI